MRKTCDLCGCYRCDCDKPAPVHPIELTSRQVYRIRLEAWRAFFKNSAPIQVGVSPNPFTEIEIDEYNKRLYIIEHGSRKLHGPKRVRKPNYV